MYMERGAIGAAAPTIMREFHVNKISMGWALSAFNWSYALFQVPAGWMADRFGPRIVLAAAMAWWSVFTAATGLTLSTSSLAATRFLFGIGEAAAFPAGSRALVRWLPVRRRAFGQGAGFCQTFGLYRTKIVGRSVSLLRICYKGSASAFMKKTTPNRQNNKLSCPHCGQTFQRAQALGGHIRYKHASLASKPARPKEKEKEKKDNSRKAPESLPVTTPAPTVPAASVPMLTTVPSTGAQEHLQTALQELTERNHQIDEDLARLEGLQAEKEIIRKQIDAVNSALQAFEG
jgi:uncharacterized C2H2 Zn-finger protein